MNTSCYCSRKEEKLWSIFSSMGPRRLHVTEGMWSLLTHQVMNLPCVRALRALRTLKDGNANKQTERKHFCSDWAGLTLLRCWTDIQSVHPWICHARKWTHKLRGRKSVWDKMPVLSTLKLKWKKKSYIWKCLISLTLLVSFHSSTCLVFLTPLLINNK